MVPQPIDLVVPVEVENTYQISKENFDKIKKGRSLAEVESIIAGTNQLISTKNVNGKVLETYRWETADSAKYIEVTFENNKVMEKKQKGLK